MEKHDNSFEKIIQTEETIQTEEIVQAKDQTSAINWETLDLQIIPQIKQHKCKHNIHLIALNTKIRILA